MVSCLFWLLVFHCLSCQHALTAKNVGSSQKENIDSNIFGQIDYFHKLRQIGKETKMPEVFEAQGVGKDDENVVYNVRQVPIIFFITVPTPKGRVPFKEGLGGAFGSTLALHDFNHGISTVIEAVEKETKACPNLKLTADIYDSKLKPRDAAEVVAKLLKLNPSRAGEINKHIPYPTAIMGAGFSSVSAVMSILAGVKSVPVITGASISGVLDNKGVYPTFGRVIPPQSGVARAAVKFLSEVYNVTHMGIIFRQDDFGNDMANAIKQAASSLDKPMVVAFSPYTSIGSGNNFSHAVKYLKDTGFHYFYGAFFSYEYENIMTEAYNQKIAGPGYYWTFGASVGGITTLTFNSSSPAVLASTGNTIISLASAEALGKNQTRFEQLEYHWRNATNAPESPDYFHSLLPDDLGEKMQKNLGEVKNIGTIGAFMYDTAMAVAFAACRSFNAHGPFFTGQQLFDQFKNISFFGTTGFVSMDKHTASRETHTTSYDVSRMVVIPTENEGKVTFRLDPTYISVTAQGQKSLEMKWEFIEGAELIFSDNTTVPPNPLPPYEIETISIETWAQSLGITLCIVIDILSIFFSVWTALHRNTKVVKASQPLFLHMLCVGTFIIGLAIIPLTLQDPIDQDILDVACMATPWLVSGGFVIAFSAVLSKLKRVNAVFGAKSHTKVVVATRDVLRPFTILFVFNATVLVVWTTIDPVRYNLAFTGTTDQFDRPIERYGRCINYDPSAEYLTLAILWAGVIIVVVVWANFEAYKARGVATEFSESQYLAISMALILQAILIGLPLLFVVDALPTFWYLVETSILFIVCMSMLLPIFVPKILHLRKWQKEQSNREFRKSERIQKWAEMRARIDGESQMDPAENFGPLGNTTQMHPADNVSLLGNTTRTRRSS